MSPVAYLGKVARVYDALYRQKPYAEEVQWVLAQLGIAARGLKVLEVACGTGKHAAALAEAGASVTGVDVSEDLLGEAASRVARCEASFADAGGSVRLIHGDMRQLDALSLGGGFDASLSFFDSLGYAIENEAILQTVRGMVGSVKPGGHVAVEVWAAPAMMGSFEPLRTITFTDFDGAAYERTSRTTIDLQSQTATVEYAFVNLGTGESFHETHRNRFFMPQEMVLFFSEAGLRDVNVVPAYEDAVPLKMSHFHLFCHGIVT